MIKGKRIYLKLIERCDINILLNICDDEHVNRYNSVLPDKKYLLNNFYIIKNMPNKILSVINEKGVIIGFIDYRSYDESIYTVGITIGKRFWGRGYGKESIKTLVDYLFAELGAKKIIVEVMQENIRAINCSKSCGFTEDYVFKRNGESIIKMFLLNDK